MGAGQTLEGGCDRFDLLDGSIHVAVERERLRRLRALAKAQAALVNPEESSRPSSGASW
jgi:hypothetical protein